MHVLMRCTPIEPNRIRKKALAHAAQYSCAFSSTQCPAGEALPHAITPSAELRMQGAALPGNWSVPLRSAGIHHAMTASYPGFQGGRTQSALRQPYGSLQINPAHFSSTCLAESARPPCVCPRDQERADISSRSSITHIHREHIAQDKHADGFAMHSAAGLALAGRVPLMRQGPLNPQGPWTGITAGRWQPPR